MAGTPPLRSPPACSTGWRPRSLIVPGLALASVGLALRTGVEADGSYATHRLPGILLLGFGLAFGLAFMLLFATAAGDISPQKPAGPRRPHGPGRFVRITSAGRGCR
ncbi:hypothetical protein ACFQ6B_10780 [Streptomyces wedmorensis]|uniref:Uncharacterized protein n=1 Tax=Streptomyces wedmorensis TaxID=43759 RepID=A0ABW6ILU3_STRWE